MKEFSEVVNQVREAMEMQRQSGNMQESYFGSSSGRTLFDRKPPRRKANQDDKAMEEIIKNAERTVPLDRTKMQGKTYLLGFNRSDVKYEFVLTHPRKITGGARTNGFYFEELNVYDNKRHTMFDTTGKQIKKIVFSMDAMSDPNLWDNKLDGTELLAKNREEFKKAIEWMKTDAKTRVRK